MTEPKIKESDNALKQRMQAQLEKDLRSLMYEQPFLAMLTMRLHLIVVVDDRLQTAATDGVHLYADARFMQNLSERDRLFILAHEVWHCALQHFGRKQFYPGAKQKQTCHEHERNHHLWNIACDFEVNAVLAELFGFSPPFVLFDKKFVGFSAEQIYARLFGNKAKYQAMHTHDLHQPWAQGSDQSASTRHDPDYAPVKSSSEIESRWRHYVAEAQEVARRRGHPVPESIRTRLAKLLRPELPWYEILRRYMEQSVGLGYTWQRPNRRYLHQGMYLPGHRSERLKITVAVDTSGSTQRDLNRFFSELKGILQSFTRVEVTLIECDTRVHTTHSFDEFNLNDIEKWRPQGGGGTEFIPVFTHIANDPPQLLVFFTDGLGEAPEQDPGYPVLWVLTKHGHKPTRWGQAVALQSEPEERGSTYA